jgi:hypothetical protein
MYIQSWRIDHRHSNATGPPVKILNGFQKLEWRNPFIKVHHLILNGWVIIKLFKRGWTGTKKRQPQLCVCKDCKSKITQKREECGFNANMAWTESVYVGVILLGLHR